MVRWLLAFPLTIAVMIVNVLIFVSVMFVYGTFINTGQSDDFYQEVANKIGPYSSILAGIPLMFFAGRWFGQKFESHNSIKAALLIWLIYFVLDFLIILLSGELLKILLLFIISFATKFIGAYLGGYAAQIKASYSK